MVPGLDLSSPQYARANAIITKQTRAAARAAKDNAVSFSTGAFHPDEPVLTQGMRSPSCLFAVNSFLLVSF